MKPEKPGCMHPAFYGLPLPSLVITDVWCLLHQPGSLPDKLFFTSTVACTDQGCQTMFTGRMFESFDWITLDSSQATTGRKAYLET